MTPVTILQYSSKVYLIPQLDLSWQQRYYNLRSKKYAC